MLTHLDVLGPAVEVRLEPGQWRSCHSEENLVADCVERCRQVKTDQDGDLLVAGSRIQTVQQ